MVTVPEGRPSSRPPRCRGSSHASLAVTSRQDPVPLSIRSCRWPPCVTTPAPVSGGLMITDQLG